MFETLYYEVVSIDGDYANLKRTDIDSADLKLVARALLPTEITVGSKYISMASGQKRSNIKELSALGYTVKIIGNDEYKKYEVSVRLKE